MTDPQSMHITHINDEVTSDLFEKYEKGTREHEGALWQVPALDLVDYSIEEVLDLINYLYTLRPILRLILSDPIVKARVEELLK